jgi:hypothetical protein
MVAVHTQRCNPYGYGTDTGPRHLMGGLFGPEYAGRDLLLRDGIHGIGVCPNPAAGRFVAVCPVLHSGPEMWLCQPHVIMLQRRMLATCTRCVMPPESRALWEDQDRLSRELYRAWTAGDRREYDRLVARIEDIGHQQVQLTQRGLTPKRPLKLVEVS